MKSLPIEGVTLGYDDVGAGDAVVLIHGHPFNRGMWRPQLDHLSATGWRAIAPELRGYGASFITSQETSLTTFATDIAQLLDHLSVNRIVLGGLSMGGQIVMEFYRLFPDRVRALILADTTMQAETEQGKQARRAMANRLLQEGMTPYAREVLSTMIAPQNIQDMPELAENVFTMMRETSPIGAAAALRGRAKRPDYGATLANATVPALVVVGSADEFTPIEDAQRIQETMPDAQLAVIDGAAHMPNVERPEKFNKALDAFLESLHRKTHLR